MILKVEYCTRSSIVFGYWNWDGLKFFEIFCFFFCSKEIGDIYIYVRYLRYVMVDRCYRSLLSVRREGSIVVDRMIWRIELQAYRIW